MTRARQEFLAQGRPAAACDALLLRLYMWQRVDPPEELEAAIDALRADVASSEDALLHATARYIEGSARMRTDYSAGLALRKEARDLLLPLGASFDLAHTWYGIANLEKRLNNREAAGAACAESARLAPGDRRTPLERSAQQGAAQILRRSGKIEEAVALYEEMILRAGDSWTSVDTVELHIQLRPLYHQAGRYVDARRVAEEAVQLARENGLRGELAAALDGWASEEAMMGRLEQARSLFEEGISVLGANPPAGSEIFLKLHLAQVHLDLSQADDCERLLQSALKTALSVGHARGTTFLRLLEVRLALQRDRWDEALRLIDELRAHGRLVFTQQSWSLRLRAQALAGQKELAAALASLDEADSLVARVTRGRFGARATQRTAREFLLGCRRQRGSDDCRPRSPHRSVALG